MKYELNKNLFILNDGQVILTSDEEIKEGDTIYNVHPYAKNKVHKVLKNMAGLNNPSISKDLWFKIIAAHPKLDGVPLLNLETNKKIIELADKIFKDEGMNLGTLTLNALVKTGFIKGYKEAKKENPYTEQDIRDAYIQGCLNVENGLSKSPSDAVNNLENYIQSLKQPKIQSIELEEISYPEIVDKNGVEVWDVISRLRIINKTDSNPDGEVVIKN